MLGYFVKLRSALGALIFTLAGIQNFAQNAPPQPEFSNFSPVRSPGASVDEVTGSLSFNTTLMTVPGPNGGFPISISYSSDNNQTSWVGQGWTLNPGSVTRSANGFYDDARGDAYKMWSKAYPNYTVTTGIGTGMEVFSTGWGFHPYISYNSYTGFGTGYGLNFSLVGLGLGMASDNGAKQYSVRFDPAFLLQSASALFAANRSSAPSENGNVLSGAARWAARTAPAAGYYNSKSANMFHNIDRLHFGYFPQLTSYTGKSISGSVQIQTDAAPVPVGIDNSVNVNWTKQQNVESKTFHIFGYNHLDQALDPVTHLMDYNLDTNEPNSFIGPETKFLPQVVSGADVFNVAGHGISGSFRGYSPQHIVFGPNKTQSKVDVINVGADVHVGLNFGLGVQGGGGHVKQTDGPLEDVGLSDSQFAPFVNVAQLNITSSSGIFYRFHSDAGRTSLSNEIYQPLRASLQSKGGNDYEIKLPDAIAANAANNGQPTRSANIRVFTNSDYTELTLPLISGESLPYAPAMVDQELENLLDRQAKNPSAIAGIEVTNVDGVTYGFHHPLYSKNELDLSVNAFPGGSVESTVAPFITKNVFDSEFRDDQQLVISGHEMSTPHATTFLLTGMMGPDYVDLTGDGYTLDDPGALARFHYTTPEDYRYRFPERGFYFQPGRLSTKRDDMASFTSGVIEVAYLHKIETATHVATFFTSDAPRYEAIENSIADELTWFAAEPTQGRKAYHRLDRIELAQKNPDGSTTLLETVYFEYENGSRPGDYMLKKYWKEPAGVREYLVQATQLEYQYPDEEHFETHIREKFHDVVSYGNILEQAPPYSPYNIDPWGNYQANGHERHLAGESWIDQSPSDQFDPAAWKLKMVKLPSGAEIIAQYEQRDFTFTQDQRARSHVPLLPSTNDFKFYINAAELNISPGELQAYRDFLQHQIVENNQLVPYKLLYSLLTDSQPNLNSCDAEWVEGFMQIQEVGLDDAGVFLVLAPNSNSPRSVCTDMVQLELGGAIIQGQGNDCYASAFGLGADPDENTFNEYAVATLHQLQNKLNVVTSFVSDYCRQFNPEKSYVQLPVFTRKLGGGVRVKRLLTYGRGPEPGTARLYGSEYRYTAKETDGSTISSGVASNEFGNDNALVKLIDLENDLPAMYSDPLNLKVFSGYGKTRRLGPLLGLALPAPTIYHSHVTAINLSTEHQSYSVSRYYTHRDFPSSVSHTDMQKKLHQVPPVLTLGFYSDFNQWCVQGFTSNNIEAAGLPVYSRSYKGIWNDDQTDLELTSTSFEYYMGLVPVVSDEGTIESTDFGLTSETVSFGRQSSKEYLNAGATFDFTFGFMAPFIYIPFPVPGGYLQIAKEKFSMFTTTTINTRELLQKSVTSVTDGVAKRMENVAFDPRTGLPAIQRTYDSYDGMQHAGMPEVHDGSITTENIPAHTIYKSMRSKSDNERFNLKWMYDNVTLTKDNGDYSLTLKNDDDNDLPPCLLNSSSKICPGDILKLQAAGATEIYVLGDETVNGAIKLHPYQGVSGNAYINIPDGQSSVLSAFVIRSGNSNTLTASAGVVTHYGKIASVEESEKLAAAHQLAEMLTEAAQKGNKTTNFGAAQWPAGLKINYGGNCFSMSGLSISLTTSDDFDVECSADASAVDVALVVPKGMLFQFDAEGYLTYYMPGQEDCQRRITCFRLCFDETSKQTQSGILSASAQVFTRDVNVKPNQALPVVTNPFQSGMRYLRPESNHVFITDDVVAGNALAAGERNYTAGTFTLNRFNFDLPGANAANGWIKTNAIDQYAQSGAPLESENALGIKSIQKSYAANNQPFLVATNATSGTVFFESFERFHVVYDEDASEYITPFSPFEISGINAALDDGISHTGKYSLHLFAPAGVTELSLSWNGAEGKAEESQLEQGVLVRAWVNTTDLQLENKIALVLPNGVKIDFEVKSNAGSWRLIEAVLTPSILSSNVMAGQPLFSKILMTQIAGGNLWIDDIFVKSFDTSITGIVYDEFFRPSAVFDNSGYSLQYTYSPDGTLLRKSVETAEGLKPLEEQRSHMKGSTR